MAETREAKLTKRAAELGLEMQKHEKTYRLVNASTGTLVAADWAVSDGFGLDLDAMEAALGGPSA